MSAQFDMPALQVSWQAFDNMAQLRLIHTEADYNRTIKIMNALLDVAGDDDDHPLSSLIKLASDLVSRYEQKHYPINVTRPKMCEKSEIRSGSRLPECSMFPRG